jgi:hypothetical protein
MSGVLAIGAAWVALAVLGAFLLARAVRLADRRAAAARIAVAEERKRPAESVVGLSPAAAAQASGDTDPDAADPQRPGGHERPRVGKHPRRMITVTAHGATRPQRHLGVPAEQP